MWSPMDVSEKKKKSLSLKGFAREKDFHTDTVACCVHSYWS